MDRKYLPTLSELIDRLSIAQLKEVFITEHKEEYAQEISDILHDIDLTLKEKDVILHLFLSMELGILLKTRYKSLPVAEKIIRLIV